MAALLFARQRRLPIPLPPALSFVLENPITEAFVGAERILDRAGISPGMRVLDAGCGPGRIATAAARRVLPDGEVLALDGQREMLGKLRARLEREGVGNVSPVEAELGAKDTPEMLGEGAYDVVLLVMVFGEIRGRERALAQLYRATREGGVLSVTEAIGDPDYHPHSRVREEAEAAGFRFERRYGGRISYTMNFVRPCGIGSEPGGSGKKR